MNSSAIPKSAAGAVADLVTANHLLVDRSVLDAYGHVSVRDPEDPDHFFLSRNLAPASVAAEDIQRFDLDANTDDTRPGYLERFIHAELYRARPDVQSVVHSHSASIVPFTISTSPLRAVWHMAGFLGSHVPVFEIRNIVGTGSDLLISDPFRARALAEAMGDRPVALIRGHGSVTVGSGVEQAVFRAVFAELNARAQAAAMQLGDVTYLTEEEGIATTESNEGQIARAWEVWSGTAFRGSAQLP